jgi:hypothetical protein
MLENFASNEVPEEPQTNERTVAGPRSTTNVFRRGLVVYLLRPDGYVGLADPKRDMSTLNEYLDRHGLEPGRSARRPMAASRAAQ